VAALEPLLVACGGTWVAHGCGSADRETADARGRVDISGAGGVYRLRRVWLGDREAEGYYNGFANRALWPLCHYAHVQPEFSAADFASYRSANARFADAICDEVTGDAPLILVQDYHLMLVPELLRRRLPGATIVWFSHVPFPSVRKFAVCPWARQLVDGLLGSTIAGFQTPEDCHNFVDTARALTDARVASGGDGLLHHERRTSVRAYPVSVEWPSRFASTCEPAAVCRGRVRQRLGCARDTILAVGVDRLDYTKGIDLKMRAVERLLDQQPELRGRFVFAQIAEPSRATIAAYQEVRARVAAEAARINARFGSPGYRPIVLLEEHHDPADVFRFLRAADICYVGSLHDGMNLVAKEFASARDDERGVLVLSRFAGAALELTSALVVNPYATDQCAEALARAVRMSGEEQGARMRLMRAAIARSTVYAWAGSLLADAARTTLHPLRSIAEGTRGAAPAAAF
jgi:trehalose 6-phosphate synthase